MKQRKAARQEAIKKLLKLCPAAEKLIHDGCPNSFGYTNEDMINNLIKDILKIADKRKIMLLKIENKIK